MKMKSKRRIDRDRGARDPRRRVQGQRDAADTDTELDGELDIDLAVLRSLEGYDE